MRPFHDDKRVANINTNQKHSRKSLRKSVQTQLKNYVMNLSQFINTIIFLQFDWLTQKSSHELKRNEKKYLKKKNKYSRL